MQVFDKMSNLTTCQVLSGSHSESMKSATSSQPKPAALTAKQLEIRQRSARILDTVFPIICEQGLSAVNVEAIAREMQCTRGTIYNHFPNKEEILLALATRSVRRRMELFRFAVTLGDRPRECCAAIGMAAEVYVDCLPDDFAIEQIIRHVPVWQKTSPGRREVLTQCEQQCIGCLSGVVESAVQSGDLIVDDPTTMPATVSQLVFGLWSLVYGGLVLEATSPSLSMAGISDARTAIRRNCNALLDEIGWRPLYDSASYEEFIKRITPRLRKHIEIIRVETIQEALE